jgi:mono/diheme cytochrome c family protein
MSTLRRGMAFVLVMLCGWALAGCEKTFRNMYDQPKHLPADTSPMFGDTLSSRPPPPGSIANSSGDAAGISSGERTSEALAGARIADERQTLPTPLSSEMLNRGHERYDIYCMPCHSPVGDGDGRVVERGFPSPPSFHIDRLRAAGDRYFYDVISKGYGVMYPYDNRVEPADRWAIVAYIRALQLSQHADAATLPPDVQTQLNASSTSTPSSLAASGALR